MLGRSTGVDQTKHDAVRLQARFAYATNGIDRYRIGMDTQAPK
ncbi:MULTISPECIES: hypothetical protein [unclassified Xanthomonas]|nr:hypothetical protein [Xanthomonas sp. LMG 8992]